MISTWAALGSSLRRIEDLCLCLCRHWVINWLTWSILGLELFVWRTFSLWTILSLSSKLETIDGCYLYHLLQLLYLRIGHVVPEPIGVVCKYVIVQTFEIYFSDKRMKWDRARLSSVSPVYHPFHLRMTGGLDAGERMSEWRVDQVDWMDAGGGSPAP